MILPKPSGDEGPLPPGMMLCPDCKHRVSKKANSCPSCGRAIQASAGNIVWKIVFWVIVLGGLGAILSRLGDLL